MKFINLKNQQKEHLTICTDICVIGAGAAGVYFSYICAEHFNKLTILEAGDITASSAANFSSSAIFNNEVYSGAISGRAFGIGGTSSIWGGLLAPYSDVDDNNEKCPNSGWRTILNSIRDNADLVLKNLEFHSKHNFNSSSVPHFIKEFLTNVGIITISSLTLPFGRRNFCWMLKKDRLKKSSAQIIYNATVMDCNIISPLNGELQVESIDALSENGKRLTVIAKKFVIANGAIESTRLLLEFQHRAKKSGFFFPETDLGIYFGDHISASIATFKYSKSNYFIKYFFPIFRRNWIQSFRFILRDASKHPRHFFYFQFYGDSKGLKVIKAFLQYFQSGNIGKIDAKDFLMSAVQIIKIGFNRYINKRLYVENGVSIKVQLDIEQHSSSENRIFLSDLDLDNFGRKKIYIQWGISKNDILMLRELANKIINDWNTLPKIFPKFTKIDVTFDVGKPYDIYHPSGSCRIGSDLCSVVDDATLNVRGFNNIYLLSTSLFPTAGSSNPTFSLLCIAHTILSKLISDVKN